MAEPPEIVAVKSSASLSGASWETDLFYAPTPVQEERNERPFHPVAMIWMDTSTGICLSIELLPNSGEPDSRGAELVGKLVSLIKEQSLIPHSIRVLRPAPAVALAKVAGLLGCSVEVSKHLPALEGLKKHLFDHFA
jgi:hypothetical protein